MKGGDKTMKTFQVWYMKPDWFRQGIFGAAPNVTKLEETHVFLTTVEAESREEVFSKMQAEVWGRDSHKSNKFLASKGLAHTSMSTGDVVVEGDRAYLVLMMGFADLGLLPRVASKWR